MRKSKVIFLFFCLGLFIIADAGVAEPKIPGRTKFLVNDYAGVLSPLYKDELEKQLREVRGNDFTGTEIDVSTFKTLDGMPFDAFIREYARKWRRPALLENDNRMHIVVITDDGKLRIGVGNYVLPVLTTEKTKNIIDNVITPELARGDYNSGIRKGIAAILKVLEEGKLPKSYTFLYAKRGFAFLIVFICVLAVFVLIRKKNWHARPS